MGTFRFSRSVKWLLIVLIPLGISLPFAIQKVQSDIAMSQKSSAQSRVDLTTLLPQNDFNASDASNFYGSVSGIADVLQKVKSCIRAYNAKIDINQIDFSEITMENYATGFLVYPYPWSPNYFGSSQGLKITQLDYVFGTSTFAADIRITDFSFPNSYDLPTVQQLFTEIKKHNSTFNSNAVGLKIEGSSEIIYSGVISTAAWKPSHQKFIVEIVPKPGFNYYPVDDYIDVAFTIKRYDFADGVNGILIANLSEFNFYATPSANQATALFYDSILQNKALWPDLQQSLLVTILPSTLTIRYSLGDSLWQVAGGDCDFGYTLLPKKSLGSELAGGNYDFTNDQTFFTYATEAAWWSVHGPSLIRLLELHTNTPVHSIAWDELNVTMTIIINPYPYRITFTPIAGSYYYDSTPVVLYCLFNTMP